MFECCAETVACLDVNILRTNKLIFSEIISRILHVKKDPIIDRSLHMLIDLVNNIYFIHVL